MEKFAQPEGMRKLLEDLLLKDTYNKFCVDCNLKESTHANITYGTFICETCYFLHVGQIGMYKSYVKSIYNDLWDEYQLKTVTFGGNKIFWDFMRQYNSEQLLIKEKYSTKQAKFYKKRLHNQICDIPFHQEQPPRNFDEALDKGVDQAKVVAMKAGEGLSKIGSFFDRKITGMLNRN